MREGEVGDFIKLTLLALFGSLVVIYGCLLAYKLGGYIGKLHS